jgi:hypothetical protein
MVSSMQSTIDTSTPEVAYSPLQQEVRSILQQLGNPGVTEQSWDMYQQQLLDSNEQQLSSVLPQLRIDMLDSLMANAAKSKSLDAFAEAYLYQVKNSITQDQANILSSEQLNQVLQLEQLYHRFPEIIHASCIIHAIIKLQAQDLSHTLTTLAEEYTLFQRTDVLASVEQPSEEELHYLEMISTGMKAHEIAKVIYKRHTELLEVSN